MATVTREREEQDAFNEQMRRLHRAARHSEKREDDDAAEACRWAESRMRHERAAALASPPAEDELQRHDCEAWAMEGIGCAHCNPVALAIRAAQAPPASDPPGLVEVVAEFQRAHADYQRAKHEDVGQEFAWSARKSARDAVLAYPLPASPQAETKGDE